MEKIEEINQRELVNIREELEMIRNRQFHVPNFQFTDYREKINFKNYRRNLMELLERIEENITKNRETRWTVIRSILDEHFKDMTDNWWTATQHDINDYPEFRALFKAKCWSESTQNIVRDNLCNKSKYDPQRGQSPTAYFLGKVCLARNLEPKIPEECLVTKLYYHCEEMCIRDRIYIVVVFLSF